MERNLNTVRIALGFTIVPSAGSLTGSQNKCHIVMYYIHSPSFNYFDEAEQKLGTKFDWSL